ncbi:DEAD/DEAH box helicase family protein [Sulfitobacter sp. 1A15299]|uniref:DEAD/DEAH box helicase family protein n=1 Tax=Sulfitobacter sp. 1A15299 TaxID=3368598 RepID=UPI003746BFFB
MKHKKQPGIALRVPRWSTPVEARAQLDQEINRFVKAAADGTAEPDAALAMRVTAGLGKTATALRAIARYGKELLAQGHVLIYVPTLDLATRAHADFSALAPGLPSRVIRGRDAQRPDDLEKKMCERAEIAKEISAFVPSVTRVLCRGLDPDGNFVQSPCALGCPYLEQKDVQGTHITFLSHAYLTVDPPIDRDYRVVLRVIDEKVWPTLARTSQLAIDDFMRAPAKSYPENLHGALSRAKAAIVDGLQRNLPLHDHLRSSGIDTMELQSLSQAESQARCSLELGPWQSTEAVEFRLGTFDKKSFINSQKQQRIFKRLAEKEAGHCVGLKLRDLTTERGSQRVIQSASIAEIDRDAPVLFLDADADPDITERIAHSAAFVSIQSPPVADIVQVSDLTLSNSWLLHPEKGADRRAAVLNILECEIDRAGGDGVLVVATKSVLAALHGDLGQPVLKDDDGGLRQPLLGAVPRWFGPKNQGVNDFEGFASIVIIGRLQLAPADIEASARAVYSQDTLPVMPHAGPLPKASSQALMSDGSLREAVVRAHPDSRAQTILAQSRECATLQAIARLRLVSPARPKRVVILSNMPLPDFPITRLSTLSALERGLEHEPDWQGFVRIENALRAAMGRPVRGTRLSAAGLTADLPRDFESEDSAKRFRRGRPTSSLVSLCQRVAAANAWKMTPLMLKRPAGGKPVPAIILDDLGAPLAMARSLWPDLTPEIA